jgi:hypothetical protein
MVVRRLVLRAPDVVFFKGVIEASEGLAAIHAEKGGDLLVAAPADREAELDDLIQSLGRELGALGM